jgi:hypothetical protein
VNGFSSSHSRLSTLVDIERAVRLSWPASTTVNYSVETAPTIQGPWMPASDLPVPGLQELTVPTSEVARFFRLRRTP